MQRLAGQVAVVTGGASGIGAAIVARLLDEGASVVATDIEDDARERSGRFLALRQDVTCEDGWQTTFETTAETFGALDILVNNAGVSTRAPTAIADLALEDWRRVLAVNLDGVFLGVKHAMRAMSERGGAIVNVASMLSFVGVPDASAYCASKGGVLMLTRAAALEGAARTRPIRVNSIHPGYVETPLVAARMEGRPERRAAVEAATPLGRLATPEEIAAAIMPMVLDETRYMTGAALCMDGGYTAQ